MLGRALTITWYSIMSLVYVCIDLNNYCMQMKYKMIQQEKENAVKLKVFISAGFVQKFIVGYTGFGAAYKQCRQHNIIRMYVYN